MNVMDNAHMCSSNGTSTSKASYHHIDPSQDWLLVRGMEDSGCTISEFTRNWATCDDKDRDILVR